MNRSRCLLPVLLAAALVLGACSKTEEKAAATSAPAAPAVSADSAKRAPTVEIVASEGKGFTVGSMMSATIVYVFFDPQCSHCAHLWNAAIPLQKKARFVWMPVGLINATSTAQGATLLSAADPTQAMTEHETSLIAGKGGIAGGSGVTDEAKQAVAGNTKLFNNLGLEGVPFTVVKNARTGQLATRGGSMDTAALANLIGVDAP
jgi:thiol:disulfide interchange protein DsbG